MTEQKTPKAAPARRNPPRPAPAMRQPQSAQAVAAQWRQYRADTPIAVEVFLPPALCEALDALADEVSP